MFFSVNGSIVKKTSIYNCFYAPFRQQRPENVEYVFKFIYKIIDESWEDKIIIMYQSVKGKYKNNVATLQRYHKISTEGT